MSTGNKQYYLVARGPDWYANIPITKIEKINQCVYSYNDNEFVAMFDLDEVDMLYRTEGNKNED